MQKKQKRSGIIAGVLLPMGIICLFALGSLVLALYGGRVYKSIQLCGADEFETTITANYLRTKLSQNNKVDAIWLANQGGTQVLTIELKTDEGVYETRIFVHQGQLMESFTSQSKAFAVEDAVPISAVQSCTFSILDDNLFLAEITSPNGAFTRVAFALVQGGSV
ncbi:DUF4860 domain-containing protein [Ruminococcaceae bacterium OttesenSCG-928-A16]|nr:DUF4860 domain-containing protein [Ruminococcaceae bacterium OttesenSCG-928-A16]